ncbi:hypothetical protein [Candidatus Tisiphia endosymbiont of Beris chalybata]|uniref:hypothetical protein n=1 Tax=Candidatus Tisiphia endosymbiont of Beris chalybata TaxID=3066262 RepID=UPI00312CA861
MIKFRYNYEKNSKLLLKRGIGFEEIIQAIADGNLLDITKHPNHEQYPNQNILYVRIVSEVYAVPYITEDEETIFLKTLFPSRKAREKFLG